MKTVLDGRERLAIGWRAAADKKALEAAALDLRAVSSVADYFLICHGSSDRQVRAIADGIEEALLEKKQKPISVEGQTQGQWVLLDYGDVVFHVFLEERRRYYRLERLWADARDLSGELGNAD